MFHLAARSARCTHRASKLLPGCRQELSRARRNGSCCQAAPDECGRQYRTPPAHHELRGVSAVLAAVPLTVLQAAGALADEALVGAPDEGLDPVQTLVVVLFLIATVALTVTTLGVLYLSFVNWTNNTDDRKERMTLDSEIAKDIEKVAGGAKSKRSGPRGFGE